MPIDGSVGRMLSRRSDPGRIVLPRILALLLLLSAAIGTTTAAAAERAVVLDAERSRVAFTLGTTFHEVHGTMPLTAGVLRFDPATGAASGTITVDARRTETGNRRRDETMHADVLKSERHPTIVFRLERVEGNLVDAGRSDLRLVGVLTLLGTDHATTLNASVEEIDGRVRGGLAFSIPYVEWGLQDPSFFVARAAKTVSVVVTVEGSWADAITAGR